VQQDEFEALAGVRVGGEGVTPAADDASPDREERINDFLARHGGAGSAPKRQGRSELGTDGWYEIPAADGYRLRCEWSRVGSRSEARYFEVSPKSAE